MWKKLGHSSLADRGWKNPASFLLSSVGFLEAEAEPGTGVGLILIY